MQKLTILISTYDGALYLKEQLNSLFLQTHCEFEIIAIDDCSSDRTLEILKSHNIKTIESKENLGVKASFSAILEYAVHNSDSQHFMFCDQDDIWDEDKIETTSVSDPI
jgi:rhamnosyltransferase